MADTAVASAFVSIVPSMKDFGGKLKGELHDPLSKAGSEAGKAFGGNFSSAVKGLAGAVAALFAVHEVISWGKESIASLARIEKISAQTTSALKATGAEAWTTTKHVEDLAGALEAKTATEAESIQQGANLLLTFKNIQNAAGKGNDIFDQSVVVMTDMARAMGTDAQSGAIQLGKALNDPTAGISALTRVGVTFSAEQKNMIKTLQASGDIMGAQKIILAELNSEFGGSGVAYAQTFAGKMDLVKHNLGTLGETIWSSAMPGLGAMASLFNDKLFPVLDGATQKFKTFADGLVKSFTGAGGGGAGFTAMLSGITDGITAWINGGGFVTIINQLAAGRQAFFNAMATALPGILQALVAALPQLVSFIANDLIPQLVDQWALLVEGVLVQIQALAPQLAKAFTEIVPQLVQGLATLLPQLITTILGLVPTLLQTALTLFKSIVDALVQTIPLVVKTLVDMLPTLVNSIVAMLPGIVQAGLNLFQGIIEGLLQVVPILLQALIDILPKLITSLLTLLPALIGAAQQLFLGLVLGLLKMLPTLLTTIVDMLPDLIRSLLAMLPQLITASITLFTGIISGLSKIVPQLVQTVIALAPVMVKALLESLPLLVDAGFQIIKGLVKGIADNAPRLIKDVLSGIGNSIIGGVKALFGIHSPSRVMYGIGQYITQGLANGIDDGTTLVGKAIDGLGGMVDSAFGNYGANITATGAVIGTGAPTVSTPAAAQSLVAGGAAQAINIPVNVTAADPYVDGTIWARQLRRELGVN